MTRIVLLAFLLLPLATHAQTNHADSTWSVATKQKIKDAFMKRDDLKMMKVEARSYFCDCYIKQLVLLYPKGISKQVPEKVVNKIGEKCISELAAHEKDFQ